MPSSPKDKKYRTISDVTKELKTSAKTINNLVKNQILPAPEVIPNGKAPFRHYNDDFMNAARAYFQQRIEEVSRKALAD